MNTYREIVICLQSGLQEYPELDYGVKLAGLLGASVKFICVQQRGPTAKLKQAVEAGAEELKAKGLSSEVEWAPGSLVEAMERAVLGHPQALALFSDRFGSTWQRLLRTIRFRHLMAEVSGPLLRVRDTCWPLKEILVCSGGFAYTIRLEKLAIHLAQAAGAKLTILHVVEPVTLDYSLAREVHDHWANLIETDTPQAQHLQKVLTAAKAAGVEAHVQIRHGQVVDEIVSEVQTGNYDMVGLGSVYSSHSLRGLYRPDVTALVSAAISCPILTMRGQLSDTFDQFADTF